MTTPDPLAGQPTIWLKPQPPLRTAEENIRDADAILHEGLRAAVELIRAGKPGLATVWLAHYTESAERVIG